ncbi:MAG: hypothetical protein LBV27_05605 [Oscillospiraceae bacterium]|nr:hypothetical protein [Oscillospiraceae bacterium]
MGRRITVFAVYCIFFIVGLILVLFSESIADSQARVIDASNPNFSSVNIEDVNRKMIPIIVTGGVIALVAGNGLVLTLNKRD